MVVEKFGGLLGGRVAPKIHDQAVTQLEADGYKNALAETVVSFIRKERMPELKEERAKNLARHGQYYQ